MAFTGFVDEFTSTPIQPAYTSYLALDFTVTDTSIQLEWVFQNQNTTYPFAQYIQVTANIDDTGIIILPDALVASVAQSTVIINSATYDITVQTYGGGSLLTIEPTQAYVVTLVDSTTSTGTWIKTLIGATEAVATASSLVSTEEDSNDNIESGGIGVFGQYLKWKQLVNTYTSGSSYDQEEGDRGALLVWTAGTGTYNCRTSSVNGNGFIFAVLNNSTSGAQIQIVPSGDDTIDGSTNDFYLYAGQSSAFVCDGSATIYSYCSSQSSTVVSNLVDINLADATSATITLDADQYSYTIQKYINTYTSSPVTIYYPATTVGTYIAFNASPSTSISVTILASDYAYTIGPGESLYLFSDGINLYELPSFYQGTFAFNNGSLTAPSLTFVNDSTTGMFLDTTTYDDINSIVIVQGGNRVIAFNATELVVYAPLLSQNGSVTAPTYSFANATQTGIYLTTTGTNEGAFNIAVDGTLELEITANAITHNLQTLGIVGSATAPAYSFISATETGMWTTINGTNQGTLNLTVNGTNRFSITSTLISCTLPIENENGTLAAPAYTFGNAYQTGLFLTSASDNTGNLNIGVNGTQSVEFTQTTIVPSLPIQTVNGSVAEPSYSFANATTTGMYTDGTNINFTCSSALSAYIGPEGSEYIDTVNVTLGSYQQAGISIFSLMSAYE